MTGKNDIVAVVSGLLARAPEWIRQDLSSPNGKARERAEETLALLIAAALQDRPGLNDVADQKDAHGL